MADNVTASVGTQDGAVFATDDISNVHYPINKLAFGALETATLVTAAAGLPVVAQTSSTWSVINAGTFVVQEDGAALTALQLIDDAVYTDATGTPSKGLAVMGTDGTNPQLLSCTAAGLLNIADGGGSLTVDGTVAVSGTVTVDGSGVTQPVSAASLPLPTGAATAANQSTGNTSLGTLAGAVTGTEMQVDVVAALPAGTNAIGKLAANDGVDIGDVDVTSISAGTNLIGDVGLSGARTSGGTTIFRSIDLDETEEEVKATGGQVYWIHAMNLASTTRFLKVYNATAASVVVGTTEPVLTFALATQGDTNGAGFTLSIPNGIAFATAITVAATTGVADNDTGAPGANEVLVNLGFA